MQAIFEIISIVVCLLISTKAADRLSRDPKENCLGGRQKLSTSSCKDLFEKENKFPAREVDMLADEHLKGACCKHIHRRNRTFGKKIGTRKMKTVSKHKDVMELRQCWHAIQRRGAEGKANMPSKLNAKTCADWQHQLQALPTPGK